MANFGKRRFIEILVVAMIFMLLASNLFSFAPSLIEDVYAAIDRYQQNVLQDAAYNYVSLQGFEPNPAYNDQTMMLYIWQEDGQPALESDASSNILQSEWLPLRRKEYIGIEIHAVSEHTYEFTVIEREQYARIGTDP